jgi:hypothetical protein
MDKFVQAYINDFESLGDFRSVKISELNDFIDKHGELIQLVILTKLVHASEEPKRANETKGFCYGIAEIVYNNYKNTLQKSLKALPPATSKPTSTKSSVKTTSKKD